MRNVFIGLCLLFCLSAKAQSNEKKGTKSSKPFSRHFKFHSINQFGLLEGERGSSFQLQTINGFAKNYWFAGIGAGIDHYFLRTVPVFIDLRKNILKKEKSPFIYADAGINFPWPKEKFENYWYKEKQKSGRFIDVGIGYNLPVSKAGVFVFSIGYSEKKLQEERYNYDYLIFSGIYNGTTNKSVFDYRLRRISVKAGWRF